MNVNGEVVSAVSLFALPRVSCHVRKPFTDCYEIWCLDLLYGARGEFFIAPLPLPNVHKARKKL